MSEEDSAPPAIDFNTFVMVVLDDDRAVPQGMEFAGVSPGCSRGKSSRKEG